MIYEITPNIVGRFEDKWVEDGAGCWIWTACIKSNGYGIMATVKRLDSRNYLNDYAARISYQIHIGEIPEHHKITQICGHKNCVNPDHLLLVHKTSTPFIKLEKQYGNK